MAFQSVPDCVSATFVFNEASTEIVNRLTFAKAGGYDQSAVDDLCAALDQYWATYWRPLQTAALSYINAVVKGLENQIDFFSVNNANTGPGTRSGTQLPNNVTWAIRFTTGAIGRSARGRMYVCGLVAGDVNEATNSVTTTAANNWLAALETHLGTAVGGLGWQHVIVSRFHDNAERATGVYRQVTGYGYHDLVLDSQRGRLPG